MHSDPPGGAVAPPRPASTALRILLVAFAYYLTGRLGLLLAIPPGYATAVWPPSGIALVSILAWGYRVSPGILAGSLLINIATSFDGSSWTTILASGSVAAGIGLGASLQAAAGTFLIRRFVGFPNSLVREQDVVRFLLLGGPVACLVSATMGITGLWAAGMIPASGIAFNWWTWWVGDTIGVLVCAPLVLIWTATPREIWKQRRISVGIPLCGLFGLAIFFFARISAWEQEELRVEFNNRADVEANKVRESFENHLDILYSLSGLYEAFREVGEQEFAVFAEREIRQHPGIQALEWIPRVRDEARSDFERRAASRGHPGFKILERHPTGRLEPATRRADYFPVQYLVPRTGNEILFGYDVASDAVRAEALWQASERGAPAATARITLLSRQESGVLVFLPVYEGTPAPDRRGEALRGFVTAVLRPTDILGVCLGAAGTADLSVRLVDTQAAAGASLLARNGGDPKEASTAFARSVALSVAGRSWALHFAPNATYLDARRSWKAWAGLAGMLLFTGLLGAFLLVVSGRSAMVEQMVTARTAELSSTNASLEREVAERRRSEDALKISEERFRLLGAAAPIGIFLTDIQGNCLFTNARWQEITGLTLEQSLGEGWSRAIHPDDREEVFQLWSEAVRTKTLFAHEFRFLRPDGRICWVSARASELRSHDGTPVGFVGTDEDVTERREMDRRKREFISVVSHELRTPLTSISGALGLISSGVTGPLQKPTQDMMNVAYRNCDRLIRLINDILDLEKVESGRMDFHLEPLPLTPLVEQALEANRAYSQPLQVSLKLSSPLPGAHVRADADRMMQVLTNLLSNAAKYSPPGAGVTVDILRREGGIRVSVSDQGPGIPEEFRERIFQKFAQADSSDTRQKGGTGLGLSIVKAIIEKFGGRVGFDSGADEGSTFWFELPECPAPEPRPLQKSGSTV